MFEGSSESQELRCDCLKTDVIKHVICQCLVQNYQIPANSTRFTYLSAVSTTDNVSVEATDIKETSQPTIRLSHSPNHPKRSFRACRFHITWSQSISTVKQRHLGVPLLNQTPAVPLPSAMAHPAFVVTTIVCANDRFTHSYYLLCFITQALLPCIWSYIHMCSGI